MLSSLKPSDVHGPAGEVPKRCKSADGISPIRPGLHALLNQRLASAVDLQLQVKHAQWNVRDPGLIDLHILFKKIARSVEFHVDLIAERIVQLGGVVHGTVRMIAARTQLEEYPVVLANSKAHMAAVTRALSAFGDEVRATPCPTTNPEDADTLLMFARISRGIDQWIKFVEAYGHATN